ncbi:MAG: hypothetical protein QY871_00450 [Dehalococcoides mccartyi]|uniref:hypothetical protein n=1 Tax=Dehalococcoides mccartyi TaxID=61435 RepID=UPI0025CA976B|nr:hypothetical protein [Dehalococcoides mccartyi]MDN4185537.1 hypothetical protein [Dehalococcoides mccartyi]
MRYKALLLQKPRIVNDGEYVIAYADDLKLVCPGKTEKEALASLNDTARKLINAMKERGVLEKRMQELGIKIVNLNIDVNDPVPTQSQKLELVPA